jgi:sec-independent protein translocase protein TatA
MIVRSADGLCCAEGRARRDEPVLGTLGWQELLIILVILALLFGASRVADLGGALGRGIREFRQEARAEDDEGGADGAASSGGEASKSDDSSSGGG